VRVLLIGLGRWGEKHLRVLRSLGADVWVADVSPARRAWAATQGVAPARAVADYRVALPHVDAVDIVTPADGHLAVATTCLEAGRDCFVEKPLALTAAEGRALEARGRATGRLLQVGHIFRFHPVTEALRTALDGDRIGPVRYGTGRFAGFKRPRTDVGVTQTDGIHYFDLFAFLLGRDATAVTAIVRDYLGRGLDDVSFATVEYGPTPVVVEAGYLVPGTHRECVIVGERGSLVADFGKSTVVVHLGEHRPRDGAWEAVEHGTEELKVTGDEPLRRELGAFLDCVARRTPTPVDAAAGVRALEVVEAAARSSQLGRRVTLDGVRSV
jgi:UDP-N-acetylglucosamine 3-dehydrogenase